MTITKKFFYIHMRPRSPLAQKPTMSIVAAASYISGSKLHDENNKRYHDSTKKKGVQRSLILLPKDSPEWAFDRAKLWNAVDAATQRWDERRATEFILTFPFELSQEQREDIGIKFAELFVRKYGCAADIAFHAPNEKGDQRNFHAHVFLTHRRLGANGFEEIAGSCEVKITRNGKSVSQIRRGICPRLSDLHEFRQFFAELQNQAFEAAGLDIVVDPRSYKARGLDIIPTVHEGPAVTAARRAGRGAEAIEFNEKIKAANKLNQQRHYNAEKFEQEASDLELSMRMAQVETDRERNDREMRTAIGTQDSSSILNMMSKKQSTFSEKELVNELLKHVDDEKKVSILAKLILNHSDVVGLRESAHAPVTRYTTLNNLEAERKVLAFASNMAKINIGASWAISRRMADTISAKHKRLIGEQMSAFMGLTGEEGIAILHGEAGTGKSTVLKAVREAYESAGKNVVGMSWTNNVLQDLKNDGGFKNARTIDSAIKHIEWMQAHDKPCPWDENTILVVDEASMLSTEVLRSLITLAAKNGSKLIMVGDDKQLTSIEAGGLFGSIMTVCKTYKLNKIWRICDDAPHPEQQRLAYNLMHRGNFIGALKIFENIGALHWSNDQKSAKDDLVRQYLADCRAEKNPETVRMIFAYSNNEADALNETIRWEKQNAGEMGKDHILKVRLHEYANPKRLRLAVGDRIQFRENGKNQRMKDRGFLKGACADILDIDDDCITVRLDKTTDGKRDIIKFKVGENTNAGEYNCFRRGFASTIYSGQGKSIEHCYLLYSPLWRADSTYVALTRHRLTTKLFIPEREENAWWSYPTIDSIPPEILPYAEEMYESWSKRRLASNKSVYSFKYYVNFVQRSRKIQNARSVEHLAATMGKQPETRAASMLYYDEQAAFNEELQKARCQSWLSVVVNSLRIVRANRYRIDDIPDYKLAVATKEQKFSTSASRKTTPHTDEPTISDWVAAPEKFDATKAFEKVPPIPTEDQKHLERALKEQFETTDIVASIKDPQVLVREAPKSINRRWWMASSPHDLTAGQLARARKDYDYWRDSTHQDSHKNNAFLTFNDYMKCRMRTKSVPPLLDISDDFGPRHKKPMPATVDQRSEHSFKEQAKIQSESEDSCEPMDPWLLDPERWEQNDYEDWPLATRHKKDIKKNSSLSPKSLPNKGQ